jgi:hypothetical protein
MSKKTRVILTAVIIEVGLAGIWWYLARYGMANPDRVASEFQQVVGKTMGMAMGAFLGLCVILFFVAPATIARHCSKRGNADRYLDMETGTSCRFATVSGNDSGDEPCSEQQRMVPCAPLSRGLSKR